MKIVNELQQLATNGQWQFCCYLPHQASIRGAYGPAAELWHWAKEIVSQNPGKYRIIEYNDN